MLLRGDVRIELLQWVDVPTTGGGQRKPMTELGFTHLSFRVEELDDLTDAVVAAGGAVHPQTISHVGPEGTARTGLLYYTDPDGTRIEVMTNVPDLSAL
jgi:glyoxylase I family protein